jgi:hypothetical protein
LRETLLKKNYGFVREDYSINSKRLFFSVQMENSPRKLLGLDKELPGKNSWYKKKS